MLRPRLFAVCCLIVLLSMVGRSQHQKKRLLEANKTKVAGSLVSIDRSTGEVKLKTSHGDVITRSIRGKELRTFERLKSGAHVLIFEQESGGRKVVTDACTQTGNSPCGGSADAPCSTKEEIRFYYECEDDDGNQSFYNDCEVSTQCRNF